MNFFKKNVTIPSGSEQIEAAKIWTVRWKSYGEYNFDIKNQVEVFFSREDAVKFMDALKEANKLLKNDRSISASISE